MNSVYKYYVNPEGYGKFVHHLHRLIYPFNKLQVKCKVISDGILIVLLKDNMDAFAGLTFDEYNKIVEALSYQNYCALCIKQFDRFIKEVIFNNFYNSKFI